MFLRLLKLLRDDIDRLAEIVEQPDYYGLLFALGLLGQFREPRALRLVIDLARQDDQLIDGALGFFTTEVLGRLLASVWDCDLLPLKQLVLDETLDSFVRQTGLTAFMVLVVEGAVERETVVAIYREFINELPRRPDYAP